MAAVTWFQRAAHVRPGATRLNEAAVWRNSGSAAPDSTSANSPFRRRIAGGLAAGAWPAFREGASRWWRRCRRLQPLRFDQPFAGSLIDEWVETVPSPRETTGVTFITISLIVPHRTSAAARGAVGSARDLGPQQPGKPSCKTRWTWLDLHRRAGQRRGTDLGEDQLPEGAALWAMVRPGPGFA